MQSFSKYIYVFRCKFCGEYSIGESKKHPFKSKVRCKNGACSHCDKPYVSKGKNCLYSEVDLWTFDSIRSAQEFLYKVKLPKSNK